MLLTERLRRASYIPSDHESDCKAAPLVESATVFAASVKLFGSALDSRTPAENFDQEEEYYCLIRPLASYTATYARDGQTVGNLFGGALATCAAAGGLIYAAATLPLVTPVLASAVLLGGTATAAYPAVRGFLRLPPPAEPHGLCSLFARGMFDTALLAPMAAGYVGARLGTAIGLIGAPIGTLIGGFITAVYRLDDNIISPLWNCGAVSKTRNFADAVTERVLSCPRPNFNFDAYAAGDRLRQRFASLSKKTPAVMAPPAAPISAPDAPKGP